MAVSGEPSDAAAPDADRTKLSSDIERVRENDRCHCDPGGHGHVFSLVNGAMGQ